MKNDEQNKRGTLIRESLLFQVKLIADGLRDVALLPVSLIATAVGLVRGGKEPEREFHQVIKIGRQSEQWINLFGQHEPIKKAGRAGSIDMLLTHAEDVVRQQVNEGGISEKASRAIQKALDAAHNKARQSDLKHKSGSDERDIDI